MTRKTNAFHTNLPRAHAALQRWYQLHGRKKLPWRNTKDPYAIYLSEVMLQQTQVKTVLERYYFPFLKRFPTLVSLANADPVEVKKQWEGLGYYNRAGNLQKTAKLSHGKLPKTIEALITLPGIGRNTANAVACFAFGAAVPVMEANVKRVICRIFAFTNPEANLLWEKAGTLLDTKNPYDYNQAMMDIGALICTKRNPKCSECPLNNICQGKNNPEFYPTKKQKKKMPERARNIVVFCDDDNNYYLTCRTSRFLNGLYGFMEYDKMDKNIDFMGQSYLLRAGSLVGQITQSYSHFTLQADIYLILIKTQKTIPEEYVKATLKEIEALPLSRADSKVLKLLVNA
jgi:A/G-specific adenine glycosylase